MWATRARRLKHAQRLTRCPHVHSRACRCLRFLPQLRALPPEAFAGEVEAVCVVNQPIEDRVGVGGIADQLMPAVDWQLAGDNGGAAGVAVIEDLQKVVAGGGVERLETPIIEDEQIDATKGA